MAVGALRIFHNRKMDHIRKNAEQIDENEQQLCTTPDCFHFLHFSVVFAQSDKRKTFAASAKPFHFVEYGISLSLSLFAFVSFVIR